MKKIVCDFSAQSQSALLAISEIKRFQVQHKDVCLVIKASKQDLITLEQNEQTILFPTTESNLPTTVHEINQGIYDAGLLCLLSPQDKDALLLLNQESTSFTCALRKKEKGSLLLGNLNTNNLSKEDYLVLARTLETMSQKLFDKQEVKGKLLVGDKEMLSEEEKEKLTFLKQIPSFKGALDSKSFTSTTIDYVLGNGKDFALLDSGIKQGIILLHDFIFRKGNGAINNTMTKLFFRNTLSAFELSGKKDLTSGAKYLVNTPTLLAYFENDSFEKEIVPTLENLLKLGKER